MDASGILDLLHPYRDGLSLVLNVVAAYLLTRRERRESVAEKRQAERDEEFQSLKDRVLQIETERKTEQRLKHERRGGRYEES